MRDPEKPQQIIDAAIRVFARTGYYSSRVSDIAREAGIASGTIYLYFKTKEEILVTLFREKMAGFVAQQRREIGGEPDPIMKIRRLIGVHFGVLEQNPELAEVVQVELRQGNKFFRGASAHEVSSYFDLIASVLEEGVAIRCNNLPALAYKVDRLLDDPTRVAAMRANALRMARPHAARDIVNRLLEIHRRG